MDAHGLTDWSFGLSVSHRRLGTCFYGRKLIKLSRWHVEHDDMAKVIDTVNHEVAHALVGPGKGHGDEWQAKAVELGATPTAKCVGSEMPSTWEARCPSCTMVYRRHRLLARKRDSYYCPDCGRVNGKLTWVRHG